MKLPLYLRTYNSPFKRLKLEWYFGKVSKGLPYFLPRVWKKATGAIAMEEAIKEVRRVKKHNNKEGTYKHKVRTLRDLYDENLSRSFAQPKKIGFDFVGLGWKTKYDSYRFQYSPLWSFVFFGYQITLTFKAENEDAYWESFLAFTYETDEKLSWKERIEDCRERFSQTWTRYDGDKKETVDYWKLILKKCYEV